MVKVVTLIKLPKGTFSISIDVDRETPYWGLNVTSSVSIFQMSLTSLPVQCPRAL